jgi:hypothetical protein
MAFGEGVSAWAARQGGYMQTVAEPLRIGNPIGYFHIDIAEVRTEEGTLHLYVGIARALKFALAQLHDKVDRPTAAVFLENARRGRAERSSHHPDQGEPN